MTRRAAPRGGYLPYPENGACARCGSRRLEPFGPLRQFCVDCGKNHRKAERKAERMTRRDVGKSRDPLGWWLDGRAAFAERGAPMTDGGTAWLVWVAIPERLVRRYDDFYACATGDGETTPLVHASPWVDWPSVPSFNHRGMIGATWYAHLADAGSLAEAIDTARAIRVRLGV